MVFDNEKVGEGEQKRLQRDRRFVTTKMWKTQRGGKGLFLKKNYHIKLRIL